MRLYFPKLNFAFYYLPRMQCALIDCSTHNRMFKTLLLPGRINFALPWKLGVGGNGVSGNQLWGNLNVTFNLQPKNNLYYKRHLKNNISVPITFHMPKWRGMYLLGGLSYFSYSIGIFVADLTTFFHTWVPKIQ